MWELHRCVYTFVKNTESGKIRRSGSSRYQSQQQKGVSENTRGILSRPYIHWQTRPWIITCFCTTSLSPTASERFAHACLRKPRPLLRMKPEFSLRRWRVLEERARSCRCPWRRRPTTWVSPTENWRKSLARCPRDSRASRFSTLATTTSRIPPSYPVVYGDTNPPISCNTTLWCT